MAAISASAGYQGRGQHQRIADRADHQILVEEGGIEGARPAQARRTVDRGQVDAGGEADGPDVDHMRRAFQPMHRVGEHRLERAGALEQALVAIKVERGMAAATPSGWPE